MATTLTLALSGIANHHPVAVAGTGTLEPGRVALDLRVDVEAMDLDPTLLVLAGIDPLLAIAGHALPAPTDEPIVVRGRADLLGEGGGALGTVELRAILTTDDDGGLSVSVNVGPAWAALEIGERVIKIAEGTLLVRGPTILTERLLHTRRGKELLLAATLRSYGMGALVARPRPLTLPPTNVKRVGGGSAFGLALEVRAQDPPE